VIVVSVPTPGLSATILEGARDALRMKRPHLTDIKTYAPQEEYPASPKSKVPHHVQQLNDRERRRRWRK
jgi:hypothetical protein